jgi:hypothetical protein
MKQYAQWLAGEPGAELTGSRPGYRARHPMAEVRAAKASFCAHRTVQAELVRKLEKRADFREYFEKLRADTQFHSKELVNRQIPRNFELRAEGLEMAYKAGDYGQIRHYTDPFVNHAVPKQKVDRPESAPRIVIQIGSAEAKKMIDKALSEEEEPQEVEYEVISQKLLEDGDEDD